MVEHMIMSLIKGEEEGTLIPKDVFSVLSEFVIYFSF